MDGFILNTWFSLHSNIYQQQKVYQNWMELATFKVTYIKYRKWQKIAADEYFLCIGYVCLDLLYSIHFLCLQSSSDFHCVIVPKHTVNLPSI